MADDVLTFSPLQLVWIDRYKTAHVLRSDGSAMCSVRTSAQLKNRIAWIETFDPAKKPWPVWPCQTCAGLVEDITP